MNIHKSPQPLQIIPPKAFWTKKSITSEDLPPSSARRSCGNNEIQSHKLSSPSQRKPFPSSTSTAICPTCQQNDARYSCPRCLSPFCSVICYRIHDVPSFHHVGNRSGDSSSHPMVGEKYGGGRCTESFYQERVLEEVQYSTKDQGQTRDMEKILERAKVNQSSDNHNAQTNDDGHELELTDEELMELAQYVLTQKDIDEDQEVEASFNSVNDRQDISGENIVDAIPSHLCQKFEKAANAGLLNHLVGDTWHPFWLPDYEHHNDSEPIDSTPELSSCPIENETNKSRSTFEERIISINSFRTFHQSANTALTNAQIDNPDTSLQFNTIDILYATMWTLRLYNGSTIQSAQPVANQNDMKDEGIIISSAETLLQASFILSSSKAHFTTTSEALMECTLRSEREFKSTNGVGVQSNDNLHWMALTKDLVHIAQQKRVVMRVLFCAEDILFEGYTILKQQEKAFRKNINDEYIQDFIKDLRKMKRKFILAKKKIEFYLSWISSYWDFAKTELILEVQRCVRDWDWSLEEDGNMESKKKILLDNGMAGACVHTKQNEKLKGSHIECKGSNKDLLTIRNTKFFR